MLRELLITVTIAGGTALLQTIMKGSSRTNRAGSRHGLSVDDGLFWSDWTISAVLALSGSVIAATGSGKPLGPDVGAIAWGYGAIIAGGILLPFFLRTFAYGPNAQLNRMGPGGSGWLILANAAGIGILFMAVAAGVQVYEW
uniref:Uncharacterized protein n=1 Tax=Lentzea miocenica TaxID=3095431 RepID=A0ABU4SU15_9PSEU|nr:hypothetical protein [Lentzea sp. BCCO 10_0856]MDX8029403.1 hypothetical protein [Lentzea sp. BCCO 10_0856]